MKMLTPYIIASLFKIVIIYLIFKERVLILSTNQVL